MSGQIGQTRTFYARSFRGFAQSSLPFHHFPELSAILAVLSNNFPGLEAQGGESPCRTDRATLTWRSSFANPADKKWIGAQHAHVIARSSAQGSG